MEQVTERPKVRDNITLQDLGDEIMLYDADNDNVHVLNHTAGAIWNLCDGNHTLKDIRNDLAGLFPEVNESELADDINATMLEFKEKKLIT